MPNSYENTPQRGQYVSMQGGETPTEQAEIFQLKVDSADSVKTEQFSQLLIVLEKQFPELNSGLMTQAWLLLDEIEDGAMMKESAAAVKEAFGEVEAEDRNYLPLVSVYFALLHNLLEAQWREKSQSSLVLDWLSQVKTLIEDKMRELEQKLIAKEAELTQDKNLRQDYQQGVRASYTTASHMGQRGLWQHTKVIAQEDQAVAAIKEEMSQLRELEMTLNGYCSLMIITNKQPLQVNLS